MTDNPYVQNLIDSHAGDMLNYINQLPLSDIEKGMLEVKAKELLLAVSSDVMHSTKKMCMDSMHEALFKRRKND